MSFRLWKIEENLIKSGALKKTGSKIYIIMLFMIFLFVKETQFCDYHYTAAYLRVFIHTTRAAKKKDKLKLLSQKICSALARRKNLQSCDGGWREKENILWLDENCSLQKGNFGLGCITEKLLSQIDFLSLTMKLKFTSETVY